MAEVASAYVSLLPSTKGFGRTMSKQVGGEVDSAGKKLGSRLGTAMKFGAAAALGGAVLLGNFLKDAIGEANEAAKVTARTENVIKEMGNAAGVSAEQVADLAGAISAKSGIDDEAIQSGQNLLLTFKNVRDEAGKGNDIFSQTSQLMVDMSTAMGTDVKGAAIQLGKALNDPVKGLTALTRVGVSFTEGQKKTIESLVETGDTMAAQKIILSELEDQFGGAAEAMATPAEKAQVAWDNFKEKIGTAILPKLNSLLTWITDSFLPALSSLWDNLAPAREAIGKLAGGIAEIVGLIRDRDWGAAWGTLRSGTMSALTSVKDRAKAFLTGTLLPSIVASLSVIRQSWAQKWGQFWRDPDKAYAQTMGSTRRFGRSLGIEMNVIMARMLADWRASFSAMPGISLKAGINSVFSLRTGLSGLPKLARAVATDAVIQLGRGLSKMPTLGLAIGKSTVSSLVRGFSGAASMLYAVGQDVVRGLINGIKSMASSAASAAIDVVMDAVNAAKSVLKIGSPSKVFEEVGMWSMEGFANGIKGHGPKVLDALGAIHDRLKSQIAAIKSDLASLSDSVTSAFRGDLFEASDTQGFLDSLYDVKGNLESLRRAFRKLVEWGLNPGFLSQLMASGNSALILDMASGRRGNARVAASLFGDAQSLSKQLGGQVARNQYGDKLDRANDHLAEIRRDIKHLAKNIGKELDSVAGNAARRR